MTVTRPALTVVIPTRDRPELLAICLEHLRPELRPEDTVIVVDSASAEPDAVRRAAGDTTVLRCDRPGASLARNVGWQAARTDLVAFVDDDLQVEPGWADALVAAAGDGQGFVAGRTTAPAGTAGEAASVTWGRPAELIGLATRGVVAASNNLLVRREALLAVGGFDERLGPGTWLAAGEDLELLDRLLEGGWAGRYAHDAVGRHEQWREAGDRRRLQYAYGKGMGARVAAAGRRDAARGRSLFGEVLRLGGLVTLLRRLLPGTVSAARTGPTVSVSAPDPASTPEPGPGDVSGWAGPLLWRGGALVGLLVGLVVLRPQRSGPQRSGTQPVRDAAGPAADDRPAPARP